MDRGYIIIWRCIRDNHFWQDKPFDRSRAWIDLIMWANHTDGFIRQRGISVPIKRGQVGVSEVTLADKWGWSRGKVRRFLKDLVKTQQIEQQNNNVTSLITITNYNLYQLSGTADDTASSTADGQQTDSKQYPKNNGNNEKKKRVVYPSLEEVKTYCLERGNSVDPNKWHDYYSSNGWMVGKNKMKDWKACVRTWEKNQESKVAAQQHSLLIAPDMRGVR